MTVSLIEEFLLLALEDQGEQQELFNQADRHDGLALRGSGGTGR